MLAMLCNAMQCVLSFHKHCLIFIWSRYILFGLYVPHSLETNSNMFCVYYFTEYLVKAFESIPNTSPFDVTGHPALSINAGFSDGLPVGMMIVGRKFDEATVLNVAYAYEKIRDAKE